MAEMRETAVEFKFKPLLAGETRDIVRVKVAAGEFKRGMLLETSDGLTYAPAQTVAIGNYYTMCVEDVVLEAEGEVVTYKEGYFNKRFVTEINTDAVITDNAVEILKTKNIYLVDTIEQ